MNASEVEFQHLLAGAKQYQVPLFQRTYNWSDDNWERLWTDILEIYAMEPPRGHFLGAVVTLPLPDSPEYAAKHMLIDGQQRMTTLFIILAAIRDRARDLPGTGQLSNMIDKMYLTNEFALRPEERYKLRPTQRDFSDFTALIDGTPMTPDCAIAQARAYFMKRLGEGDLNEQPLDLSKLVTFITGYLVLVSINLDQDDSPHRIFESLNNTGMPLTAGDLIRNHLFMMITPEEQAGAYNQYWMPMQSRMEEGTDSSLSDFFWRFSMRNGADPRYDEVYEEIRKYINAEVANGRTPISILQEFDRYSTYYMKIWRPEPHETRLTIRRLAERLNRWDVEVAYPFLLTAYDRADCGLITEDELSAAMKMIESFVVRRIVCAIPTNRLRSIFARMSSAIGDADFVDGCRQYLMDSKWPDDYTFRSLFCTTRLYIPSRLSRTRLILDSLEASFDHLEQVPLTEDITIEHVMPQTLNDQWRDSLAPNHADVHARLLHTIGNLTLTAYNPNLSNMPFSDKKPILAASHFELNRRIAEQHEWTEAIIQQRALELADRATVVWPR